MRIKLNKHYRSLDRHLTPGEYTTEDIGALAQYLVDNGHAELIESADAPEPDAPADDTPDYYDMTLTDLRALLPDDASEDGIVTVDAHWTQRRDELADWLTSND